MFNVNIGCWIACDLFGVRKWALFFQTLSPLTHRPNIKEIAWPESWKSGGHGLLSSALSALGQELQGYVE